MQNMSKGLLVLFLALTGIFSVSASSQRYQSMYDEVCGTASEQLQAYREYFDLMVIDRGSVSTAGEEIFTLLESVTGSFQTMSTKLKSEEERTAFERISKSAVTTVIPVLANYVAIFRDSPSAIPLDNGQLVKLFLRIIILGSYANQPNPDYGKLLLQLFLVAPTVLPAGTEDHMMLRFRMGQFRGKDVHKAVLECAEARHFLHPKHIYHLTLDIPHTQKSKFILDYMSAFNRSGSEIQFSWLVELFRVALQFQPLLKETLTELEGLLTKLEPAPIRSHASYVDIHATLTDDMDHKLIAFMLDAFFPHAFIQDEYAADNDCSTYISIFRFVSVMAPRLYHQYCAKLTEPACLLVPLQILTRTVDATEAAERFIAGTLLFVNEAGVPFSSAAFGLYKILERRDILPIPASCKFDFETAVGEHIERLSSRITKETGKERVTTMAHYGTVVQYSCAREGERTNFIFEYLKLAVHIVQMEPCPASRERIWKLGKGVFAAHRIGIQTCLNKDKSWRRDGDIARVNGIIRRLDDALLPELEMDSFVTLNAKTLPIDADMFMCLHKALCEKSFDSVAANETIMYFLYGRLKSDKVDGFSPIFKCSCWHRMLSAAVVRIVTKHRCFPQA